MNTLLDYLTVLTVAALLLAPSLHGLLHERRIDRQLGPERREQEREEPGRAHVSRPGSSRKGGAVRVAGLPD
ncbi:hypothetical protein BX286_4867 [Streptomyces sp. 3211.6]|uniref:hypothetical protein n=1 Tax=Streptomyces TaxID=1883 RepID=UPI0009A525BF|nr:MULTISPECIES: hypothetical protein [Streptomyces]RKT06820.1 hypothetical protein BX286_4867 [Streptomyces sp. 3211.6]RPF45570.1 hypothetical protein EDD96_2130 [Streptomyces sp. Ag109_G2-6]